MSATAIPLRGADFVDRATAEARQHELRERTLRSMSALGVALQAVPTPASPQVARSAQAAESAWRSVDSEFGLLTSTEVGDLLGSRSKTGKRNLAGERHRDGLLLGVRRGNALRFPRFQFDEHGQPRPVVARLRQLADVATWSEPALIVWLCTPHGRLDGRRPVDIIGDEQWLYELTADSLSSSW